MYDTFMYKIKDILDLVKKGDSMTLKEKKKLDSMITKLRRNVTECFKPNGIEVELNDDQKRFIHFILPIYITSNSPKLDEVCKLFDIDIYEDTLYGNEKYTDYDEY